MGRQSFSRSDRLSSTIQKELSQIISQKELRELKDPKLTGLVSITDVRVTSGYQHLDVFISIFEEENTENILKILKAATSSIRGELCRRLKLRFAPTLEFHIDDSIKRSTQVWSLLDNLKDETV
jgi:ribosome-binding factor A